MEYQTLADQYCPEAHSAAITAAAFDSGSGAAITADAWGVVAITRPGEKYPSLVFQPGNAIYGAVAVAPGGALVGVGDEDGTVAAYKTWDGSAVFSDYREGAEGAARAMRALAFNPQGTILASLGIDGVIRVFDIQRWERIANWQGFAGESLQFDDRGEKLLAVGFTNGTLQLLFMTSNPPPHPHPHPEQARSSCWRG